VLCYLELAFKEKYLFIVNLPAMLSFVNW